MTSIWQINLVSKVEFMTSFGIKGVQVAVVFLTIQYLSKRQVCDKLMTTLDFQYRCNYLQWTVQSVQTCFRGIFLKYIWRIYNFLYSLFVKTKYALLAFQDNIYKGSTRLSHKSNVCLTSTAITFGHSLSSVIWIFILGME